MDGTSHSQQKVENMRDKIAAVRAVSIFATIMAAPMSWALPMPPGFSTEILTQPQQVTASHSSSIVMCLQGKRETLGDVIPVNPGELMTVYFFV
ncbi:MAG: hypothetical protein ACI9VM_000935, partial [Candidatus Azotimanducaceae bacterium]